MTPHWQLVLHGIQILQKASHKKPLRCPIMFEDVTMPMASAVPQGGREGVREGVSEGGREGGREGVSSIQNPFDQSLFRVCSHTVHSPMFSILTSINYLLP